uniref:TROVE domain-containing protein n=1 Tax=Aureoumbra lagunensis TaxID=44058 RepID=A0A7S3NMF5_9STRA
MSVNKLFKQATTVVADHVATAKSDPKAYAAEIKKLVSAGIDLSSATRAVACALCWATDERETAKWMLTMASKSVMTLPEVVKMLKLLDAPRRARQAAKKVETVTRPAKKAKLTKAAAETAKDDFSQEFAEYHGATGALMKLLRRKWLRRFTSDELEYFALAMPSLALWREFADLVHPAPGDFTVEWFLPFVYGSEAPKESLVALVRNGELSSAADAEKALSKRPGLANCYSYLRQVLPAAELSAAGPALAGAMPLAEAIWWYEELIAKASFTEIKKLNHTIKQRLEAGEPLETREKTERTSYGKLMERLLYLRRKKVPFIDAFAQRAETERIASTPAALAKLKDRARVVVFGDASSSMQVAIDAAAIVASALGSALDADLSFFDSRAKRYTTPKTVSETLACADKVRANGTTAPAACLWEYYSRSEQVDLFVVVTDEEENSDHKGKWSRQRGAAGSFFFADLFEKYLTDVNPHANLFFVSFLKSTTSEGQMVTELTNRDLSEKVTQFRFDPNRPDLSKFTSLLANLTLILQDQLGFYSDDEVDDSTTPPSLPLDEDVISVATSAVTTSMTLTDDSFVFVPPTRK